jgi:hypothetical protein
VVNAVMLRPLPYRDGGRFVAIFGGTTTDPRHFSSLQSADARAYADGTQAFDAFGWFREAGKNLMFAGEPHHVQGVAVTLSLVTELGVAPLVGGWFTDGTGVVVSHSLWQRLGGDAAIVGRTLTLDGHACWACMRYIMRPAAARRNGRPGGLRWLTGLLNFARPALTIRRFVPSLPVFELARPSRS